MIALSGGVDSVALLDCAQRARRKLRMRLSALHVNHQLSPNAVRWSRFCSRLCRARGIPFESVTVSVRRGDSLEARARDARYAVFARRDCNFITLAHHRDDQVETLLLQMLRGAGVKGLAGMPPVRKAKSDSRTTKGDASPAIVRPLLDVTRQEILGYAKKRKLKWIEDESNSDVYFLRNYLRHEVLPVIARRFPAYRSTIARTARHLAEAAQLLDEVAVRDGQNYLSDGSLAVEALRRLSIARARNLLRYFLGSYGVSMPGVERLEEALRQALGAKKDAQVSVGLGDFTLKRHAGRLHLMRTGNAPPAHYEKRWRGEKKLVLPALGGVLALARATGNGISLSRLREGVVTIRSRQGGERLQPNCRRPRRSLKNLLQEARVAPWVRQRLPLMFCGEDLVWAAGIGVDCNYRAADAESSIRPVWRTVMRGVARR